MPAVLAAFLLAQGLILAVARMSGVPPFRASSYARWDSHNYISIATRGYYVEIEGGRVVGGNVAWFPGYALLVRAVASRHLTPAKAGMIVTSLFALLVLALSWVALHTLPGVRAPALALGLAALFPGFVYHHAVFPISMVASLMLFSLMLAARGRYLAAGGCGALAAVSYSTGFLVALPLLVAVALDRKLDWRWRARAMAQAPLLVGAGVAAVILYQGATVGWDAFPRMQREYFGNRPSNPLATLAWNTAHVWSGRMRWEYLPQVQTMLVALLVVGTAALYTARRTERTALDTLLMSAVAVLWVFPLVVGRGVSPSRAESLLVISVPLLARLPPWSQAILLAVFAALGMGMAAIFFGGSLV